MTDAPKPVSRGFRTGIAVATLALAYAGIGWIIVAGNAENSLHQSALAWLFASSLAVMLGIGIASVTPQLLASLSESR